MFHKKKIFFLPLIISSITIVLILSFHDSSEDFIVMSLATDKSIFTSPSISYKNSSELFQQLEKVNECPPKPTSLEKDPRTLKKTESGSEPIPPIRIKVPTLANIGNTLIIEGNGFIPLEKVRIELTIDWLSDSPEYKDKIFFQCKIQNADSSGRFITTLIVPKTLVPTSGMGKYSIIGMESRQEKTAIGSFVTSKIEFSSRQ